MSRCDGKASVDGGFGYIEPGHGVKGRQKRLMSNDDIADMYAFHDGKKEILLWRYSERVLNAPTLQMMLMKVALCRNAQGTSKLIR